MEIIGGRTVILEVNGVNFTYSDGTAALRDIKIQIPSGQFTALLGPNGSGKTTFFKVVTGLLKPARGEVKIAGRLFREHSKEEIYRRIGLVFQDPNDQLFAPTVGEDVAFGPTNLRLPPSETAERVRKALEEVGMLDLINKPIHYLSYGQKKRAAIAGVLAMRPEVIILDEPTAGLDPAGSRDIMRLLVQLNKDQGKTILMATHDVDLVPIYADRIFVFHQGQVLMNGNPAEVFGAKEVVRGAGLRLPRVAHLAEILTQKDHLIADKLPLTIGEARHMILEAVKEKGGQDGG